MSKDKVYSGQCEGVDFYMSDYFKFHVKIDDDETKSFDTYAQMKEWVEKLNSARKSSNKRKLSLFVVGIDGVERVITGRHAGHGKVIAKPEMKDSFLADDVYPNVAWVVAAVAERLKLIEEADKLKAILDQFEVKTDFSFARKYGSYDPTKLEDEIRVLVERYEKARAAADKTSLVEERKKDVKPRKLRL